MHVPGEGKTAVAYVHPDNAALPPSIKSAETESEEEEDELSLVDGDLDLGVPWITIDSFCHSNAAFFKALVPPSPVAAAAAAAAAGYRFCMILPKLFDKKCPGKI